MRTEGRKTVNNLKMLENAEAKKVLDDVPEVEELAEVDVNEDGYERTMEGEETVRRQ